MQMKLWVDNKEKLYPNPMNFLENFKNNQSALGSLPKAQEVANLVTNIVL